MPCDNPSCALFWDRGVRVGSLVFWLGFHLDAQQERDTCPNLPSFGPLDADYTSIV